MMGGSLAAVGMLGRSTAGALRVVTVTCMLLGVAAAGPPGEPVTSIHLLLPEQDAAALRQERQPVRGTPLEVADVADVRLSSASDGELVAVPGGGRAWRLRIVAPGSTDITVGLGRCELAPGSRLMLRTPDGAGERGPWSASDVPRDGTFWLPALPGDDIVLEVDVPAGEPDPVVEISHVARGYRDLFGILAQPKSASCNVDVACPLGDDWRNEIRSVARYVIAGRYLCTGSLVADVPQSGRPWFLTAEHCGIANNNDESMVVYWGYQASQCGGPRDGSLGITQVGAILRASRRASDFTLVELEEDPPPEADAYHSGWDASAKIPGSCVGIHHPNADEKAICRSDDPLVTIPNCVGGGSPTHWLVDDWEEGVTESGSSGSGIWDPESRGLVGTLTGGSSYCTFLSGSDCYGKMSVHWDGGNTASSRLSDWLDPGATGALSAPGHEPGCLPGDVTGDRALGDADVGLLVRQALGIDAAVPCGDATCDGSTSVADIVRVIAALRGTLPAPARCG